MSLSIPINSLSLRQLERILAIVDRCLKKTFPEDHHQRCAYAAFGVRELMRASGAAPEVMGGDFVAFTVARDSRRAGMSGFAYGEGQCSHFWVECDGLIIDPGPSYLPLRSSYPAARMPAVIWSLAEPLPTYLRYRPKLRFQDDAAFSAENVIQARADAFLSVCRERSAAQRGHLAFPGWIMTGRASVIAAARRDDPWAFSALRFDEMTDEASLPF